MKLRIDLKKLFAESRGSAGSRTLMGQMNELGHQVGRFKIRRLMAETNLVSRQPGHRYKHPGQARPDIPNLLARNFDVDQPDTVWCSDITYIWADDRWHYLAVVLDLHRRRVVGSAMSNKPSGDLVVKALENALASRKPTPGLIFHSDQGSQYASRKFRRLLWRHQIRQSMSRRGNCWDNAPMERLFRSLKTEWLPPLGYRSLQAAEADINEYLFGYYNWRRPHTANDGLPPAKAEKQLKMVSGFC
jgi:transposase InsO family protein